MKKTPKKPTVSGSIVTVSSLMLGTLDKIFSWRHIEIFFSFFQENRIWHFMQIVSIVKNKKKLLSAKFALEM